MEKFYVKSWMYCKYSITEFESQAYNYLSVIQDKVQIPLLLIPF